MDSKTDENRSVFVKTDPVWFCRLTKNRPVPFEIFKNLKIFEIKNPKKTRLHFKIFCQNRIQKFVILRPTKFEEGAVGVKIEKNILTRSF
jgi:hypothetical protein